MADVLQEILDDPGNHEHLKIALTTLLKTDPVNFYKFIAMPRLQHLAKVRAAAAKTARTAAEAEEERMWMDALSGQAEKEMEAHLNGMSANTAHV